MSPFDDHPAPLARPRQEGRARLAEGTGRPLVGLVAWLGSLALVLALLDRLGRGQLAAPPLASLPAWLEASGPAVATMTLLRLTAYGVAWYLLAATVLTAVLHLAHAGPAAAVVEAALPRSITRLVRAAVTVTAAASLAAVPAGAAPVAGPVPVTTPATTATTAAPRPAAVAVTTTSTTAAPGPPARPGASPPIIMRRLPDDLAAGGAAPIPPATDGSGTGTVPPSPPATTTTSPVTDPPNTPRAGRGSTPPAEGPASAATTGEAAGPRRPITMRRLPDGAPSPMAAPAAAPSAGAVGPDTTGAAPPPPPPPPAARPPAPAAGAGAGADPDTTRTAPPPPPAPPPPGPTEGGVTVRPGDSLWRIATDALTRAWGVEPADRQVDPYWRALVAANRHRLLDPANADLIRPGQRFDLPEVPTRPVPPNV